MHVLNHNKGTKEELKTWDKRGYVERPTIFGEELTPDMKNMILKMKT